MKKAHDWRREFRDNAVPESLELVEGRNGFPTLRVNGVLLHSQYRPVDEAQRLIDSADLDPARPVIVLGLGLGYHVSVLLERGFDVTVIECEPGIVKLALDGPLSSVDDLDILLGEADALTASRDIKNITTPNPQVFAHPASTRVFPEFIAAAQDHLAQSALKDLRLPIAIVGPM